MGVGLEYTNVDVLGWGTVNVGDGFGLAGLG